MIVFGITSKDLEVTAPLIAASLGLEFVAHESSFRCGNYYRAEAVLGEVLLQSNCGADCAGIEPFEDGWPIERLVLYFSGPDDEVWHP